MGEITLGQYYPSNSILHRLDPRVKFIGTILYIVSLFLVNSWIGYAMAGCVLAVLIGLSRVPLRFILRSMKPVLFILLFTMIFNLLLTPGDVLVRFWIFRITREGVSLAVRMGIRLAFLVMGSSIMTLTTTPNELTDAMENLFAPLSFFHVPVHEIAMMMSIALARGADFESGGLVRRVRSMIPLLVPLFVSAFRRANDLAMAMEARCYHGGSGRTQMKPLKYSKRDFIAYAIELAYLAVCIIFKVRGL